MGLLIRPHLRIGKLLLLIHIIEGAFYFNIVVKIIKININLTIIVVKPFA